MWPFKKFETKPFEAIKKPEAVNVEKTSLKDILGDDHKSVLFGEMLKEWDDKEATKLFLKLKKSAESLTPKDFEKLVQYKKTFEARFSQAEMLKSLLTEKRFVALAKNSKGLAVSLEVLGVEASYRAIFNSLELLAVKDDSQFEKLHTQLLELTNIEKNTQENNQAITEWCIKYKIDSEKVSAIFTQEKTTEEERDAMLEKVIEDSLGFWDRGPREAIDWSIKDRLFDLGRGSSEDLIAKIKPEEIPKAQQSIANILNLTLSKNEEVLKAVTKNLRPEIKAGEETGGDLSFNSLGDSLGDDKEVLGEWEQFKARNPLGKGESMDDEYKNNFEQSYTERKIGRKAGFWSKIAESFMRGMLGNLREELN